MTLRSDDETRADADEPIVDWCGDLWCTPETCTDANGLGAAHVQLRQQHDRGDLIAQHRPVGRSPESKHPELCRQDGEAWPCTVEALRVELEQAKTENARLLDRELVLQGQAGDMAEEIMRLKGEEG